VATASKLMAELLFNQRNYPARAIAYRFTRLGEGDPLWTMAWSHIQLGKGSISPASASER
jgi:hypothetical protein